MMAYDRFESARDNFGKFIHQFQPETKTLIRKLERILIRLYRQNVSLLFNQTCLNERLLPNHTHTHIYIYICICIYIYIYLHIYIYMQMCVCVCVCVCVRVCVCVCALINRNTLLTQRQIYELVDSAHGFT